MFCVATPLLSLCIASCTKLQKAREDLQIYFCITIYLYVDHVTNDEQRLTAKWFNGNFRTKLFYKNELLQE